MYQFTTDSRPASIIFDDAPAPSKFPVGATAFWNDGKAWHTVEIIDCKPLGFGYCCIQWFQFGWGWRTASVPFAALMDLDTYLDTDPAYGQFEAADYPDEDEDTGEDVAYDDYHDRQAIVRLGYGA